MLFKSLFYFMKAAVLSFLLSIIFTSYAQQKPWECIQTEGDCCAFAKCVTSDASGNSYVTGWFNSNSVALGKGALKFASIKSGGNMSIVKYDSQGKVIWAKGTVSSENTPYLASVIDKEGNSYVTGLFGSHTVFDTLTIPGVTNIITAPEMTVVKFDTKGHIVWQKSEGINSKSTSITIDKDKNVYISGWFTGENVSFGSVTIKNSGLNEKNFFLVKYDPSGNVVWARTTEGKGIAEPSSLATGPAGNLIITGVFTGEPAFHTTTLKGQNDLYDIFVVKYSPEGDVIWAKSAGGTFSDYATSIAVDQDANNYISGYFSGASMGIDTTILKSNTAGTIDDYNIFVAKYDKNGNLIWAKNADNNGNGYPDRLAVTSDKSGNCFLGGNFDGGSFSFGGKELKTNCTSTSNFILKLNGAGKLMWLKNIGPQECNALASFHIDGKQNCHAIVGSPQSFRMFVFKAY